MGEQLDMFAAHPVAPESIPVLAIVEPSDQCRYHVAEHPGAWVQCTDIDALGRGREIACYGETAEPAPGTPDYLGTGGIHIELIKGTDGHVFLRAYAERPDWTRAGLQTVGNFPSLDEARAAAEAWIPEARAHVAKAQSPKHCECGCIIEQDADGCPTCLGQGLCRQCHWRRIQGKRGAA